MNKKTKLFHALLLSTVILIYGCGQSNPSQPSFTGTQGITLSFSEGSPRSEYIVGDREAPISIVLELENKGTYPESFGDSSLGSGRAYISGFDENVLFMRDPSKSLNYEFLQGRSSANPAGGFDTVEFEGSIFADNIVVDKYETKVLATICYPYKTETSKQVCIDPFPFDKGDKACSAQSLSLNGQGAPVAITGIKTQPSTDGTTFEITLENKGSGEVIDFDSLGRCNPLQGQTIAREDFGKVQLVQATVGSSELRCKPFHESRNVIVLQNGRGLVRCTLDRERYDDAESAYKTPIDLELRYGYRITASKPVTVKKTTNN